MDTSIDSIGTCSLDMEASVEVSDWSEVSSDGTLRSASIVPTVERHQQQQHLPSYLSLACTVNGYSTTTNYDPIRLARSRDASPHRGDQENMTTNRPMYSVTNNLLSPPNLVPLPTHTVSNMAENVIRHHHEELYQTTKTFSYISKESHFTTNIFSKDSIDGCLDSSPAIQNKCVIFENKSITLNNQSKCLLEATMKKEYSNGKETKSFIQQRVERLYGPGALAQGFFVSRRHLSQSLNEQQSEKVEVEKHSKSFMESLLEEHPMKQSCSSPSLPVLRHLRPEFRAQLPIINPRKATESPIQKSVTVPKLKNDEVQINGHSKSVDETNGINLSGQQNGCSNKPSIIEDLGETKDGRYFLKILEEQTSRLLALADRTEGELSNVELSEEVVGKLRAAAGKAKLLVSQKMQQFRGLCTNNINQSAGEAFPTTNEDLQGFWDMVMLQVDQVDKLFEEIDKLRKNNWKEVTVKKEESKVNGSTKPRKTVIKQRPAATINEEARKQREEKRKQMIEERRKAMKAQQSNQPSIEIFIPESS